MNPTISSSKLADKHLPTIRLAFYRRIFPIPGLKRILLVVAVVVLMYMLAFISLNIFQWYVS